MNAATIEQRYRTVRARIAAAEQAAGRAAGEVSLIAASKQQDAAAIRMLAALGHRAFGENYLDEAECKQRELGALGDLQIEWHFIGHLQSNKTAGIARSFAWVHGVEREKIARRLSAQRPPELAPLNICLQVNVDDETSKSGVALAGLAALAQAVASLPRLRLRGLMAIPRPESDTARQHKAFATLRRARQQLNDAGLALDVLSMGMTADLEAAIAEGATHVRIGTALFGPRPAP